jgi:hypothetical protein
VDFHTGTLVIARTKERALNGRRAVVSLRVCRVRSVGFRAVIGGVVMVVPRVIV